MRLLKGTRVKLTDPNRGETKVGILRADSYSNHYAVHTIKLDDGTLYRTEGRLEVSA